MDELDGIQSLLRGDPLNEGLFQRINEVRLLLVKWSNIEETILKQKFTG